MIGIQFVHWLIILSGLIIITGAASYIRDTLAGRTKPNRVTWIMWTIAPLISASAAMSSGADIWPTSRIFLAGCLTLTVFLCSFANKQSYWRIGRYDLSCGFFSVIALIAWLLIDAPRIAILFAIASEWCAVLPTLTKAWRYPESETGTFYIANIISVLLVFPSIPEWNIENAGFQIHLLVVSSLLLFTINRRRLFNCKAKVN